MTTTGIWITFRSQRLYFASFKAYRTFLALQGSQR